MTALDQSCFGLFGDEARIDLPDVQADLAFAIFELRDLGLQVDVKDFEKGFAALFFESRTSFGQA